MKRIDFRSAGSRDPRLLTILLGIVLLSVSLVGLAQQDSTTNSESHVDFDVDALVDRVSHSKALGFFTKLSLKQEIDQLMTGIRAHHYGSQDHPIEQLHERYDVMVKKLMILLQEKVQELVQDIHNGREKLWVILSDEKKFAGM
jgi:hypothetical protein